MKLEIGHVANKHIFFFSGDQMREQIIMINNNNKSVLGLSCNLSLSAIPTVGHGCTGYSPEDNSPEYHYASSIVRCHYSSIGSIIKINL